MTATERAKRSDALYYETVSVTRRVLCDMIANREADIDELRESVKRLMTQRDERLAKAETDADKLRELVRDYERCSMHADCDRCEYDGTTSTHCPLSPCFPDIDELHELGVDA